MDQQEPNISTRLFVPPINPPPINYSPITSTMDQTRPRRKKSYVNTTCTSFLRSHASASMSLAVIDHAEAWERKKEVHVALT